MQGSYESGEEAACVKRGFQPLEGEKNCLGGVKSCEDVSAWQTWERERGFEVYSVAKREQKECTACERKELGMFGAS